MVVNIVNNTYYIWKDNDLIVLKYFDAFKFLIQDYKDIIFINNTDNVEYFENNKVVDLRILNWLTDNLSDYNNLIRVENLKDIRNFIQLQMKNINKQKENINQAIEYTNYLKALQNLFKFEYNKEEYNKIVEKNSLEADIKKKLNEYENKSIENINLFEYGIKYSFFNHTGRITPNNKLLQNIDRKNNINLFKTDKNKKYYLIDFKNFEVVPLYFYTKNEIYSEKNFYDIQCQKFNIDRKTFKDLFLMYLNGAGESKLGKYLNLFKNEYFDLEELKGKLHQSDSYVNLFNRKLNYEKKYSVLGHLCQSTAYDFLCRLYYTCYKKFNDNSNIIFRWNLYDEFFIECSNDFNLKDIFENVKFFNYRIEEF